MSGKGRQDFLVTILSRCGVSIHSKNPGSRKCFLNNLFQTLGSSLEVSDVFAATARAVIGQVPWEAATTQRAASLLERGANGLQNLLASPNRPSVDVEVRTAQPSTQQQFLNPNGQEGQQQQRQQQGERREQRERREHPQDFIQRLRLGLVELD